MLLLLLLVATGSPSLILVALLLAGFSTRRFILQVEKSLVSCDKQEVYGERGKGGNRLNSINPQVAIKVKETSGAP